MSDIFDQMTDSEVVDFFVPREGLKAAADLMNPEDSRRHLEAMRDDGIDVFHPASENSEYLRGMAEVLTYMSGLPSITDAGNEMVAKRILELSAALPVTR